MGQKNSSPRIRARDIFKSHSVQMSAEKNDRPPHATSVVDDSLFIVAPIICVGSVFRPCFVMQFCYHLAEEERDGCFTLFVYLMSCDC